MSDTLAICSHICYFKFKYVIFFHAFLFFIYIYNYSL